MPRIRLATLAVGVTFALPSAPAAHAQGLLPFDIHDVHSATLNSNRSVFVSLPRDYAWSTRRYPVLVLLDANDTAQFTAAVANIRFLASRATIPSLIILGVANGKDRTNELTPPARDSTAKLFPTAGGADAYLRFLTDELIPWADERWRTQPMRVLAGHSLGGLFALHAIAKKPDAFRIVIAMSPSIWWNDTTAVEEYAQAITRETAVKRTLFVTSGGYEGAIDRPTLSFIAKVEAKRPPTLAFAHARYPHDTHGLTPLPSLLDGLRASFAPISQLSDSSVSSLIDRRVRDTTAWWGLLRDLDVRYSAGARSLGMPPELPERHVDELAGAVEFLSGSKAALPMRREIVRRFPASPTAHLGLAQLLLAAADTVPARGEITVALQAVKPGDPAEARARHMLAALDASKK